VAGANGRRWWRYPLAVECGLEWFVYRLRGLALFALLELTGRGHRPRRRRPLVSRGRRPRQGAALPRLGADQFGARPTGDGGRKNALQDLNKDGISLMAGRAERGDRQNAAVRAVERIVLEHTAAESILNSGWSMSSPRLMRNCPAA
jgi:hypothetical protein